MKLFDLQLFATQVTTQASLSDEMKTFYDMTLIDMAEPNLVHDQFGQTKDIPQNGGKVIEFRKFASLNKATAPLTEGVTPAGNNLKVSTITSEVEQYGDYIQQSDVLEMTAIDNTIAEALKLLGSQAGRTLDTVVRDVLQSGSNVSFASKWSGTTETVVTARKDLDATATLKVDTVEQVVAKLRACNAPTIDGDYVAIIHPYASYDLRRDPEWIEAHKYAQPENLYRGEIGKVGGVRFVESSEAKIFRGEGLTAGARSLTVKTTGTSTTVAVKEEITADDVTAFDKRADADKYVYIGDDKVAVTALVAGAAGSATITLGASHAVTADGKIYDFGGTKDDKAVFGTLFLADGAYGTTKVAGGGLETIVKQKGYGEDPLNQRSSVGWKALKTAEILIGDYLVRVESCSARYSASVEAN